MCSFWWYHYGRRLVLLSTAERARAGWPRKRDPINSPPSRTTPLRLHVYPSNTRSSAWSHSFSGADTVRYVLYFFFCTHRAIKNTPTASWRTVAPAHTVYFAVVLSFIVYRSYRDPAEEEEEEEEERNKKRQHTPRKRSSQYHSTCELVPFITVSPYTHFQSTRTNLCSTRERVKPRQLHHSIKRVQFIFIPSFPIHRRERESRGLSSGPSYFPAKSRFLPRGSPAIRLWFLHSPSRFLPRLLVSNSLITLSLIYNTHVYSIIMLRLPLVVRAVSPLSYHITWSAHLSPSRHPTKREEDIPCLLTLTHGDRGGISGCGWWLRLDDVRSQQQPVPRPGTRRRSLPPPQPSSRLLSFPIPASPSVPRAHCTEWSSSRFGAFVQFTVHTVLLLECTARRPGWPSHRSRRVRQSAPSCCPNTVIRRCRWRSIFSTSPSRD